jgi:hypothetical protein
MILPGKHLRQDRALLTVGAEILIHLDEPRTVSELWERVRQARESMAGIARAGGNRHSRPIVIAT